MPKYRVYIEPNALLSGTEYIIDADNSDLVKDFAAERYLQEANYRLEFDFEVVETSEGEM